jgi:hypothetical protein
MKKLFYILAISVLALSCEKMSDDIVDPSSNISEASVQKVSAPSVFIYSENDSLMEVSIKIGGNESVSEVWMDLISPENDQINFEKLFLYDDGNAQQHGDSAASDGKYSALLPLSKTYSNGNYTIEFYMKTPDSEASLAAKHQFEYSNSQKNFPPVISNLSIPDTMSRGNQFTFSIQVDDPNGLNDVPREGGAFYKLYNPDGEQMENSQGFTEFPMFDDGNSANNGDETADDGIYTVALYFPNAVDTGIWKFEFFARDKADSLSNKITHNMFVE